MAAPSTFSCRPGFPAGLQVLVVEARSEEGSRLEKQLVELAYEVTLCSSPDEAAAHLAAGRRAFEVLLVEAKAMAPECEAGARLRAAAAALPLVLMVDKDSPYRDVMRGIELGAADVLEKPLSSLKLRNIWQHVVRKRMGGGDAFAAPAVKPEVKAVELLKGKAGSAPASPRTPSPAASQLTHGSDLTALPAGKGDEASFSGSGGQPKAARAQEVAEPGESAATADSAAPRGKAAAPPAEAVKVPAGGAQKKLRRSARTSEAAASRLASSRAAAAPPPPPAWAPKLSPAGGCVWGTPAVGMGGAPAAFGYLPGSAGGFAQGVSLGSMDALATQRCGSLVSNASTLDCGLERSSFDSSFSSFSPLDLGSLDAELGCGDFPLDDALLPADDPLFCFGAGLGGAGCAPPSPPACAPMPSVCAPIGLKLRKSASLLDLINAQLGAGGA